MLPRCNAPPFELVLGDLIPHGHRLACGMLHDPAAAEDAVQEAALKAWRKQSRLQAGVDPLPWFLAIVANECRSMRRRRRWCEVEHRFWYGQPAVSAARDPTGNDWVVLFTLGPEDARGFELLTADAVAACPGDCPERHLGTWLDLTQGDVDHWSERANVLYRRVSEGGKLISDPYIVSPITSGRGYIQGNFSQQEATVLARRLGAK